MEISEQIPASAGPYFSGWDAAADGDGVGRSISLHHPSGDLKKVSYDGHAPAGGCWCAGQPCPCAAPQTHFIVRWDEGTTEKGSSGAPLYDARTRRIVGALTGGSASCSNPDGGDAYGKLKHAFAHLPQLRLLLAGCDDDCEASDMHADGAQVAARVHAMSTARLGAAAAEGPPLGVFKIELFPDMFPGERRFVSLPARRGGTPAGPPPQSADPARPPPPPAARRDALDAPRPHRRVDRLGHGHDGPRGGEQPHVLVRAGAPD